MDKWPAAARLHSVAAAGHLPTATDGGFSSYTTPGGTTHLHRYVNEATMRLNTGNCGIDTIDRMDALVRGMGGRRISYRELVA